VRSAGLEPGEDMHLKDEEFVDLADGAAPSEADRRRQEGHLASCAECRQKLAGLRSTLREVAAVDVPEPSPLFWDHFSRRVHDAVGAEARTPVGRAWLPWMFPAAALAALLVFVLLPGAWRSPARTAPSIAVAPPAPPVARETLGDLTDPSLALVGDLSDGAGWEAAHEAGLSPRGSAEHAVTHLNDRELRELQRLLQVELAHASD